MNSLNKAERLVFAAEKLVTTAEDHPKPKAKSWGGFTVMVENPAGSVRTGKNGDGKPWRTEMKNDYGFIKGAIGADDEGLDVYLGPDENAENAYIVHQDNPETGEYDEDKVMLGFASPEEAKKAYLSHYDDPKFFGSMTTTPMTAFKRLYKSAMTKKSHYKEAA